MSTRKRIPVASQASQEGLFSPFAHLDLTGQSDLLDPLQYGKNDRKTIGTVGTEYKKEEASGIPVDFGRLVFRRETKGKGGKTVLVISHFRDQISEKKLQWLTQEIKKACGCGGHVVSREIHLQAEDATRIQRFLKALGVMR